METTRTQKEINQIVIKKDILTTELQLVLSPMKEARNMVARDYDYVAIATNYQSVKQYDRDYKKVGEYFTEENTWGYRVSTQFLNQLEINTIVEIKINTKESKKYSSVSHTYMVITANNEDNITLAVFDTAHKAFKFAEEQKNEARTK